MIGTMCIKESLPYNYKEVLDIYTKEGYRVIALATKLLPEEFNYKKSQTIER